MGPQTHVHAEDEAVGRLGIQTFNNPLTQLDKKLLIAELALLAVGLTGLGIGEDQINIRGNIELAGAQLAHTQHHKGLS